MIFSANERTAATLPPVFESKTREKRDGCPTWRVYIKFTTQLKEKL